MSLYTDEPENRDQEEDDRNDYEDEVDEMLSEVVHEDE